jgi:hypothetical protein
MKPSDKVVKQGANRKVGEANSSTPFVKSMGLGMTEGWRHNRYEPVLSVRVHLCPPTALANVPSLPAQAIGSTPKAGPTNN